MKALAGPFAERAQRTFAAGVDIALHCNGDLEEAGAVAEASPVLAGLAADRAARALARLDAPLTAFDPVDAAAELEAFAGSRLAATA